MFSSLAGPGEVVYLYSSVKLYKPSLHFCGLSLLKLAHLVVELQVLRKIEQPAVMGRDELLELHRLPWQ